MSKAWRIVVTIVLIGLLIAVICVAVGFMTGADFNRTFQSLDSRFMLSEYLQLGKEYIAWGSSVIQQVAAALFG